MSVTGKGYRQMSCSAILREASSDAAAVGLTTSNLDDRRQQSLSDGTDVPPDRRTQDEPTPAPTFRHHAGDDLISPARHTRAAGATIARPQNALPPRRRGHANSSRRPDVGRASPGTESIPSHTVQEPTLQGRAS